MTPEIMERVASLRAAAQRLQIEREREKIQSVIRYCRNRTNPNLIRILYANYLEGDARTARELIEQCHRCIIRRKDAGINSSSGNGGANPTST
jgi:hypothetical protein